VPRRARLDAELVRRGLARSREQAADLVQAGRVFVSGLAAHKPATLVDHDTPVRIEADASGPQYSSRGAHKLAGALEAFEGVTVEGRRCLDAGASTGGFTEVLLRRGASEVVAVDVGYGQLAWYLRTDPRVTTLDRTNVRGLTPDMVGGQVTLTVADLSFIPLRLVLPALAACTTEGGDLLPMVKPTCPRSPEMPATWSPRRRSTTPRSSMPRWRTWTPSTTTTRTSTSRSSWAT